MSRKKLVLLGCLLASLGLNPQDALASKRVRKLIRAHREIPEARLLDVGVHVFNPGLPENIEPNRAVGDLTKWRRMEARYLPYLLKTTLQESGFWGAVRVVPESHIVDVAISAKIYTSTGKYLKLKVVVQDARGKVWLKKKYKQRADYSKFYRDETRCDPFQSLYNRIANDLLEVYLELDEEDIGRIRTTARCRFAAELVPDAFGDVLRLNKKGRYRLERLPATNDPMMVRVNSIRLRDHMFVDILQEYYEDFHAQMREPYDDHRERSFSRELIGSGIEGGNLTETLTGVGTIAAGAGAIIAGTTAAIAVSDGNEDASDAAANVIMELAASTGASIIESGIERLEDSHNRRRRILQELDDAFDIDVTPTMVRAEGEIIRLTGSVEAQYATWREILQQIFATETGLSVDAFDLAVAPGAIISRRMASTLKPSPIE